MALVTLTERTVAHRVYQVAAWALFTIVVLSIPSYAGLDAEIGRWSDVICYAVAILGLNLVTGYSGQISLGHSAFVGIGAYVTIILVGDHDWSYFTAIVAGAVIAFGVGLLIGLPALRIRGLYLAVVTLSVAVVFPQLVQKFESITGGDNGKKAAAELLPPSWTGLDSRNRNDIAAYKYYLLIGVAGIMFLLVRNLIRSRPGRAIVAIRDNQTSAAVSGVDLRLYKTLTFGVSAAVGAIAGGMFVMREPFIAPSQFGLDLAIFLVVGLVLGGVATLPGAIPGAIILVFARKLTTDHTDIIPWLDGRPGAGAIADVLFGVGLIVFVFVLPGGVIDGFRRLRGLIVRVVPNPAWLPAAAAAAAAASTQAVGSVEPVTVTSTTVPAEGT